MSRKKEPQKAEKWPRKITSGNVAVRVYRMRHKTSRTGWTYVLAYSTPAGRKRQKFADLAAAMTEARLKADQLNAGRIEGATMTTGDRDELQAARLAAGDVPLLAALAEWQKARALAGSDVLLACETWARRHDNGTMPKITVAEAIKRFLKAKRRQGVDVGCSYESVLEQLSVAIGPSIISSVSKLALQAHLDTIAHPATRNTHRKRIVTLWKWARKEGYLPADAQTAAERTDRAIEAPLEIGTITPEQLRAVMRLLEAEHPHYIPAAVLAAFCGMRRVEIHGQDWKDIELERRFVRVTKAKRGTPARRLVPLPDSAVAWLLPHRKAKGPICDNLAIDRIRDIARTAGYDLADNGFRHTWISARVALTGDIPRTSTEAGNSVDMIHKHYRELMTQEEAESWFGVSIESAGDAEEDPAHADAKAS